MLLTRVPWTGGTTVTVNERACACIETAADTETVVMTRALKTEFIAV